MKSLLHFCDFEFDDLMASWSHYNVGVYCIDNKVNWRQYFGSTVVSFEKRWKTHVNDLRKHRHCNKRLQEDWDKYGEKAFDFYILMRCPPELAIQFEQEYLDMRIPDHNDYNISDTALGQPRGAKRSQSTKDAISRALTGIKRSVETREKISLAKIGKKFSDEVRQRISEAGKGRVFSELHKQNLRDNWAKRKAEGYKISEETRKKISDSSRVTIQVRLGDLAVARRVAAMEKGRKNRLVVINKRRGLANAQVSNQTSSQK